MTAVTPATGCRQRGVGGRQGPVKRVVTTPRCDLDMSLVTDVLYLLLTAVSFALLAMLVGVLDK